MNNWTANKQAPVCADQLPRAVRDAITRIVNYNRTDEERDYARCGRYGNSRQGHIHLNLVLLDYWLGSPARHGASTQSRRAENQRGAATDRNRPPHRRMGPGQ